MTRPPRATKRYLSRTHKEERNTHTQRERERERSTHLWAMTRDDDVCNSLSSTKASQCRFWERVPFPISFKDTHGEKSASNSFLFFRKTASSGGDSLRLAALVELTKDVPRTTAPGGFLLCEHQKRHRERERVLLPMVEMRDKKSGGSLRRESSPFLPPFSQITFFAPLTKLFFGQLKMYP